MYVDDEELNLQLFELNFNRKYEAIIAESGISALNLLEVKLHIDQCLKNFGYRVEELLMSVHLVILRITRPDKLEKKSSFQDLNSNIVMI